MSKFSVPIRKAPMAVDAAPWHTLQPWWPTLEGLLAQGHTAIVMTFSTLPDDASTRQDPILGTVMEISSGTGRARIVGAAEPMPPELARRFTTLVVFPPGTPFPTSQDLMAFHALSRSTQGMES